MVIDGLEEPWFVLLCGVLSLTLGVSVFILMAQWKADGPPRFGQYMPWSEGGTLDGIFTTGCVMALSSFGLVTSGLGVLLVYGSFVGAPNGFIYLIRRALH
jgi:hypothetical protein